MENPAEYKTAAVVGPTASGKSALAVALAKRFHGEIISCDSMQIYKGMDIGTAKPSRAEKAEVPHYLVDIADPGENFSCADYARLAKAAADDIAARGKLPIFCGGTGLYLDAFYRGEAPNDAVSSPAERERLRAYAAENGSSALHRLLEECDPVSAAKIHENNLPRVIRAIEIFRVSGRPKSEWDAASKRVTYKNAVLVGLNYRDRGRLYSRIDKRVDEMIAAGLPEEAKRLYSSGVLSPDSTAGQAIGYKEFLGFINGSETLEEAAEKLKLSTRRYAKRQLTWFSARDVNWIYPDELENDPSVPGDTNFEKIVNIASAVFQKNGIYDII